MQKRDMMLKSKDNLKKYIKNVAIEIDKMNSTVD